MVDYMLNSKYYLIKIKKEVKAHQKVIALVKGIRFDDYNY
jgi:hypothetical protein